MLIEGSLVKSIYHPNRGIGIVLEIHERKRRIKSRKSGDKMVHTAVVCWIKTKDTSEEPGYSLKAL